MRCLGTKEPEGSSQVRHYKTGLEGILEDQPASAGMGSSLPTRQVARYGCATVDSGVTQNWVWTLSCVGDEQEMTVLWASISTRA